MCWCNFRPSSAGDTSGLAGHGPSAGPR
jgi:hypothetical protein